MGPLGQQQLHVPAPTAYEDRAEEAEDMNVDEYNAKTKNGATATARSCGDTVG